MSKMPYWPKRQRSFGPRKRSMPSLPKRHRNGFGWPFDFELSLHFNCCLPRIPSSALFPWGTCIHCATLLWGDILRRQMPAEERKCQRTVFPVHARVHYSMQAGLYNGPPLYSTPTIPRTVNYDQKLNPLKFSRWRPKQSNQCVQIHERLFRQSTGKERET